MEKYFRTSVLANKISDGFDDSYSPYFAEINNNHILNNISRSYTYKIRLRRYKGNFNKIFNFYKLHGSVDQFAVNIKKKKFDMIKTEYAITEGSVTKEITTNFGEIRHKNIILDVIPEILSGTTEKLRRYNDLYYYTDVHKRFTENLNNSKYLIVIGYGFKDSEINDYIKSHFLNKDKNILLVIDIAKPQSEILNLNNVKFIEKSVIDLDIEEVKNTLSI